MIRFRKSILLVIPAVGAAIAVVATALPALSAPTHVPRMSAVELANGLLFNQGGGARYLMALTRSKIQIDKQQLTVERSVDHTLRARPTLAAAFARDIQSGNRVKVDAALTSLGRLTALAYDHEYGAASTRRTIARAETALDHADQLAPADSSSGGGSYLYVTNVVALYTAFLGLLWAFWIFPAPAGSTGSLAADRMADLVAVSLHAG